MSSFSGLNCFGQYLRNPMFESLEGLENAISKLPRATTQPIFLEDGTQVPGRVAVVNQENPSQVFSIPSDRYSLIQYEEAFQPVQEGIRNLGVQFRGSLYTERAKTTDPDSSTRIGPDSGKVKGLLIFEDPKFEVQLLEKYDEPIKVGMRFGNSIDGSMRLFADGFNVNMICANYNMWGNMFGRTATKHIGDTDKGVADFVEFADKILEHAAKIPGVVAEALETQLTFPQVETALLGINMPQKTIGVVEDSTKKFLTGSQVQQYKDQGPNVKSLFDAVTNYYTNVYQGSVGRTEWLLENASQLLSDNLEDILKRGEERRQKDQEKAKERGVEKILTMKA